MENVARSPELQGSMVLAADTVVALGRRILPKAEMLDEASTSLRLLSGRSHRVYTGITLITAKGCVCATAWWKRAFVSNGFRGKKSRPILPQANGAAKPAAMPFRGIAGSFVVKLVGSYTNVVGLPLYETVSATGRRGISGSFQLDQPGLRHELRTPTM